jgi:hypothetical protein
MATSIVKILIAADSTGAVAAMSRVDAQAAKSQTAFSKMASAGRVAFLALAAGAVALGVSSVKHAMEDEKAHAKLDTALKNNGLSWKENAEAIKVAEKANLKFGTQAAETDILLSKFVTQGQSVAEAANSIAIAQDIAAGTGKDLGAVTDMLMKAHEGNFRGLKSLGIATSEQIAGFKSYGQVLDYVSHKYKGQAAAASQTFAGKLKALKAQFNELQGAIGAQLIPILLKLGTIIAGVVDWFEKHRVAAVALGAVIGTVVGTLIACYIAQKTMAAATMVAKTATVAWTTAQWLLNAAMTANPIGLLIAGIAALVAGFVLAYKYSETFRNGINAIGLTVAGVFEWIKSHWPLLLTILTGPIGAAVYVIKTHWDDIKQAFDKVWMSIKYIAASVTGWFRDGLRDITNIIVAPFKAAFNAIASLWNNTIGKLHFSLPGWLPMIGGRSFDMPKIPTLHRGGVFNSGMGEGLALLRDGEVVLTPEQVARRNWRGSENSGSKTIINFPAGAAPAAVAAAQARHNRRNGRG